LSFAALSCEEFLRTLQRDRVHMTCGSRTYPSDSGAANDSHESRTGVGRPCPRHRRSAGRRIKFVNTHGQGRHSASLAVVCVYGGVEFDLPSFVAKWKRRASHGVLFQGTRSCEVHKLIFGE
jgi:hypothetical protein